MSLLISGSFVIYPEECCVSGVEGKKYCVKLKSTKEANEEAFNDDSKGKLKYEKWKKGTITYEDEVPPFEELSDAQLDALGEQERTDYVMNKKYGGNNKLFERKKNY